MERFKKRSLARRLLVVGGRNGVGGAPKQQAFLTECASSMAFIEVKTVEVPEWSRLPVFLRLVARMWWVRKQASAFRADVVLLWQTHALLTAPGLLLSRTRVVGSERSNAGALKGRLYQSIYGFSIRRIDCLVAPTHEAALFITRKYRTQALVAGNIFKPALLAGQAAEYRGPLARESVRFLSVGRLVKSKRFDLVMEALAQLDSGLEWTWTIVGDGPEFQSLVSLRASLNLENHVFFEGELPAPELAKVYASSSVLVSASEREGFPNVLIEASLHGLRVISSDCQFGPREILSGYNAAEFFKTGDINSLLLKIQNEFRTKKSRLTDEELRNWHEVILERSSRAVDTWIEILELRRRQV